MPNHTHARNETVSRKLHEDRDCAVLALAAVLNISYENAHQALAAQGRGLGEGTPRYMTEAALTSLGHRVLRTWHPRDLALATGQPRLRRITTAHAVRFPGTWAHLPPLLIFTNEHVAAFRDGHIHDWTADSNVPILMAWEIAPIRPTIQLGQRPPPVIFLGARR